MKNIDRDELLRLIEEPNDLLIIDVLPESKYAEAHIPGAVNIPYNDDNFVPTVETTADSKNQLIVVYCANEECDLSPKAAQKLDELGYFNVMDYTAGLEDWKNAGKQTVAT